MVRENLIKSLVAILIFIGIMGVLGFFFEEPLITGAEWLVQRIGFLGMCLVLLVTDTLVTPFPPDILLVMIAKSRLAEDWPRYVITLGAISTIAGMLGWGIGRWLGHWPSIQRLFGNFKDEHRTFIQKYGFFAVLIGAITPLPFSVTCWTAGIMGLRWQIVLAAALFRIPRFVLYYQIILYSSDLRGLFT